MSPNDLISVVVPAYNHERYVQQTIHSILNQTYQNIELIICNDGSTDGTHEKIEELLPECRARFRHVEYINRPNEGYVRSLNECLGKSKGKYLYIIASDDVAHEVALDVLHAFLDTHADYGLATGDNEIIDDAGRICYWGHKQSIVYAPEKAQSLTHAAHLQTRRSDINFNDSSFGTYESLLSGNYVPNGYLIRKSIVDRFGGYSEDAPLEDWYLMMQIAKHAKLKFIDQVLFSYRWHDSNTIKQKKKMGRYYEQTLKLEAAYANAQGYGKFLPKKHTIKLLGIKILEYKKAANKVVLKVLGIPLYKRKGKRAGV